MLKWQPQRVGETRQQYEARLKAFAASVKANAVRTKAKLSARRAAHPSKFLTGASLPPGAQTPARFARYQPAVPPGAQVSANSQQAVTPHAPPTKLLPALKYRNSSRLRGLPPDDLLRDVRRRHRPPIRVADTEEMAAIDLLMTTVYQIAEAQKRQCRKRGARLDCKTLRKLLGFLYKGKIPLRSGVSSEAVRAYTVKLTTDEPQLENPQAVARSRLRRLTDLRRRQGFPTPTSGRKS